MGEFRKALVPIAAYVAGGCDGGCPAPAVPEVGHPPLAMTWEKDEDGTWYPQGLLPLG